MSALLESIRKILNETRQDRACRDLIQGDLLPFLGSTEPVYFFLGLNPAGYDIDRVPDNAEDYIEFARRYFTAKDSDLASFSSYLPYTANSMADYSTFGQVATVGHVVPIPSRRSSDIPAASAESCWPRAATLWQALNPKLILAHGSTVWRLVSERLEVPETHRLPLKDLYAKIPAEKLPFRSSTGSWILPLPHLGNAGPSKAVRDKAEAAAEVARKAIYNRPGVRVRRVT